MTPTEKLAKIESLLKLVDESISRKEFEASFAEVLKFVKKAQKDNNDEFSSIRDAIKKLSQELKQDATTDVEELKQNFSAKMGEALKQQQDGMNFIYDKVNRIKEGKDGKTPTRGELLQLIEPLIPAATVIDEIALANTAEAKLEENLPGLGGAIRNALELLSGEDRLNVSAIEGIEALLSDVKEAVKNGGGRIGWGAHPLTIQQSGTTKAKVARVINFTGATVSLSPSGVITVAITGGSGWTIETPTGTVDGSNTAFVATNTPRYVIVDGIQYFENNGYTLSGLNITTTVPPTGFVRSVY